MKNVIRFFAIVAISAAVSMGVAYAIADTLSGFAAISIFGGLFCALVMGAFDIPSKKRKLDSIKHRDVVGQAAIFVGSVCVFTGTLNDCEEIADDLWHYGQQAHVEMLTGNEIDFNVL